jgi:hypothetical protein
LGTWALSVVVLTGTYAGYIMATTLQTRLPLPFSDVTSLAECVAEHRCVLVARGRSISFVSAIYETDTSEYRALRAALDINPLLTQPSYERIADMILAETEKNIVGILTESGLVSIPSSDKYSCALVTVPITGNGVFAFGFSKNFSFVNHLNEVTDLLDASGIPRHLFQKYNRLRVNCEQGKERPPSFSLVVMGGLFIALVVGHLIAVVVLLFEMFLPKDRRESSRPCRRP